MAEVPLGSIKQTTNIGLVPRSMTLAGAESRELLAGVLERADPVADGGFGPTAVGSAGPQTRKELVVAPVSGAGRLADRSRADGRAIGRRWNSMVDVEVADFELHVEIARGGIEIDGESC
jgi:hypothetical protein